MNGEPARTAAGGKKLMWAAALTFRPGWEWGAGPAANAPYSFVPPTRKNVMEKST